ncbi:MAG: MerR family transcriptional regulator [Pseudomonadales bacterium]
MSEAVQSNGAGSLHVAELAARAGVTPATIRYYARISLLNPNREPDNGYRRFSSDDLHRVEFIRRAQGLGLTIGDIREILDTVSHGKVPCHQVRELVQSRLHSIRDRIAELQETEVRIEHALQVWQGMRGETASDGEICPLIERLS